MNNTTLVYVALSLLWLTWSFFAYIYPLIKEIIRIQGTPTDQISALPMEGQVEVVGKTNHQTIHSLLTQKACVLWQIVVQEHTITGRNSHWVTTYTETSMEPFEVTDGTGKIQILPAGSYLLMRDKRKSSSLLAASDPKIKDLMRRIGIETSDNFGINKMLRVYEHIIEPEEEIYILGEIKYENGVKSITAEDRTPQIISDRSQRELLRTLYWNVLSRIFMASILVFMFWSFLNTK